MRGGLGRHATGRRTEIEGAAGVRERRGRTESNSSRLQLPFAPPSWPFGFASVKLVILARRVFGRSCFFSSFLTINNETRKMASRSFFAPEGQANAPASTTTEHGRHSPPPTTSGKEEDRQPFLPNGSATGRRGSVSGGGGGSSNMHLGGAGDSLSGIKALPPILSYCSASIMMTVINKVSKRRSHHAHLGA